MRYDPRTRLNTYTGYSLSCASVWIVIFAVAPRRLDRETGTTLRLACLGWWSGWTVEKRHGHLTPPSFVEVGPR
jgi:hypothetical protein